MEQAIKGKFAHVFQSIPFSSAANKRNLNISREMAARGKGGKASQRCRKSRFRWSWIETRHRERVQAIVDETHIQPQYPRFQLGQILFIFLINTKSVVVLVSYHADPSSYILFYNIVLQDLFLLKLDLGCVV
jgi:hypothetical protein